MEITSNVVEKLTELEKINFVVFLQNLNKEEREQEFQNYVEGFDPSNWKDKFEYKFFSQEVHTCKKEKITELLKETHFRNTSEAYRAVMEHTDPETKLTTYWLDFGPYAESFDESIFALMARAFSHMSGKQARNVYAIYHDSVVSSLKFHHKFLHKEPSIKMVSVAITVNKECFSEPDIRVGDTELKDMEEFVNLNMNNATSVMCLVNTIAPMDRFERLSIHHARNILAVVDKAVYDGFSDCQTSRVGNINTAFVGIKRKIDKDVLNYAIGAYLRLCADTSNGLSFGIKEAFENLCESIGYSEEKATFVRDSVGGVVACCIYKTTKGVNKSVVFDYYKDAIA